MSNRLLTILVIASSLFLGSFFMLSNNKGYDFLYGDSMGYYAYLPATFIYHNLQDMETLPADKNLGVLVYRYLQEAKAASLQQGQEHLVVQYTYGIALMEAPFFLIAHLYAMATDSPADGYSSPYRYSIMFCHMLYVLLGLVLIYRILRKYYSHTASVFSVGLMLLGTNLFWFTFRQHGMSHTPLFFLYSLLVFLTIKLIEHPKRSQFLLLGLVAGIITIIRPTDIICLIIPLLYGVYNKTTLLNRLNFLKTNRVSIGLAAIIFVLPIVPQMLYWHLTTGQYIFYSYGSQSFNWFNPRIIAGLFQFSNGFLPYAPVMIFAIAGFFLLKEAKEWRSVFIVLLPVYIYIIYSWYCFNYVNGFGSRPMIHMYPLLAIPLAAFLEMIVKRGFIIKTVFIAICLLMIGVVLNLSKLQTENKYFSDESNFQTYYSMMFSNELTYNKLVTLNTGEFQPDETKLAKIKTLAIQDFNDSISIKYDRDTVTGSGYVYHIFYGEEYISEPLSIKYSIDDFKNADWIKCSGRFMYPDYATYSRRIFTFGILSNGDHIRWKGCRIDNKLGVADSSCSHLGDKIRLEHYEYNKWGTVHFYTKVDEDLQHGDEIVLSFWNIATEQMYLDDLKIELYKEL